MARGKLFNKNHTGKLKPVSNVAETVMHKAKNKKAILGDGRSQRNEHLADSTLLHALTF